MFLLAESISFSPSSDVNLTRQELSACVLTHRRGTSVAMQQRTLSALREITVDATRWALIRQSISYLRYCRIALYIGRIVMLPAIRSCLRFSAQPDMILSYVAASNES